MAKPKQSSVITIEQISAEREIAELQLERLKHIARERTMTYEEIKVYDILTKNLLLLKGDPTVINGSSQVVKEAQPDEVAELLQIASTVSEKDIKKVLNFVEADTDVATETSDK
jgi:bacterioferritin (cytochrome b1)